MVFGMVVVGRVEVCLIAMMWLMKSPCCVDVRRCLTIGDEITRCWEVTMTVSFVLVMQEKWIAMVGLVDHFVHVLGLALVVVVLMVNEFHQRRRCDGCSRIEYPTVVLVLERSLPDP